MTNREKLERLTTVELAGTLSHMSKCDMCAGKSDNDCGLACEVLIAEWLEAEATVIAPCPVCGSLDCRVVAVYGSSNSDKVRITCDNCGLSVTGKATLAERLWSR